MPRSNSGLTLLELLVDGVALLVIGAFLVIGLRWSRCSNHVWNASTCLKTLASAEGGFRANDRDWNEIDDFWTADVVGLYTLTSATPSSLPSNSSLWQWFKAD